ncbi:MAG: hypothetical protein QM638_16490 [Nocardioides sp.]|uniref:carboxymuconolactone decarboxylase family protein n=1 Tax=Nocardioides sp. TaxID=35761 RepID=UPI0039E3DB3E
MRLSPITELDDDAAALRDRILGPQADPPPPFLMWAHNLGIGQLIEDLGAYCRDRARFPRKLRILSMMVAARYHDSASCWNAHIEEAIELGLPRECMDRLARRQEPGFIAEDERVFFAFARELVEEHFVSERTYAEALALFGEPALLDIVGCVGSFTISSWALNAFQVPIRDDLGEPFPDVAGFAPARPERLDPAQAGSEPGSEPAGSEPA